MSGQVRQIQYASENWLQSYEVYVPDQPSELATHQRYWIVYIHGGYFRDPMVDASSFRPALDLVSASAPAITEESESDVGTSVEQPEFFSIQHYIAGYASINYRLAPHDQYPQDPAEIPKYELREAHFPQQLDDVVAAIRHLQSKYGFGSNFILSGHSVGAALAVLATLNAAESKMEAPKCVVGVNGIYDFPHIHHTNPAYEDLTRNAMEPEQYGEASPALLLTREHIRLLPMSTNRFLLSHSRDDVDVPWNQVERMQAALEEVKEDARLTIQLLETSGLHDEVWSKGVELARTWKQAVNMVCEGEAQEQAGVDTRLQD